MSTDPLQPSAQLLIKLGSIIVHADEFTSDGGHELDLGAMRGVMSDPEVKEWLEQMNSMAFLPVKRS